MCKNIPTTIARIISKLPATNIEVVLYPINSPIGVVTAKKQSNAHAFRLETLEAVNNVIKAIATGRRWKRIPKSNELSPSW